MNIINTLLKRFSFKHVKTRFPETESWKTARTQATQYDINLRESAADVYYIGYFNRGKSNATLQYKAGLYYDVSLY